MLYEVLQKQSNNLESILGAQAKEFQNFSNEISYLRNKRDEIKSQCENESATLHGQQAAKLDAFVNHFKSDNDGEYIKVIKAVNEEVQKNLSNIKPLLDLAVFSVIQSMRTDPDKYSSLVYSNNPRSIRDNINSNYKYMSSGQQQQSQYYTALKIAPKDY